MDSNQLEFLQKTVLWLRDKDRKLSRDLRYSKYKTPWDIDWMRLQLKDMDCPMPYTLNGVEIMIVPNKNVTGPKNIPLVDLADIMVFQFLPPGDLNKIWNLYRAFGQLVLTKFPDKSLDLILDYCNKMDTTIIDIVNRCKDQKITGIFEAIWKQMGGLQIREDDVLGKRIEFYKEVVFRYKQDPIKYEFEFKDLGLT